MKLSLSEAFEIITEESAFAGDAEDRGFIREDEPVSVREVIDAMRECSATSCYPVTPDNAAHVWTSTEAQLDYRTGAYESRSIHVRHLDGRSLSSRAMFRLLRASGLAKGKL